MKKLLLLSLLFLPIHTKAADYTIIQQNACGTTQGSQACAFTSNVTATDNIVCIVVGAGIQFPGASCSDNVNAGGYSLAVQNGGNSNRDQLSMLYKTNVLGGSTTVTCTVNGFDFVACAIFEVRGKNSFSNLLDQSNSATSVNSTVTSLSTGNITTTHASEIIFSAAEVVGTGASWSNLAGWTQIQTFTESHFGHSAVVDDQIVTSTGTYSNTFTWSGSAGIMVAVIASFEFSGPATGGLRHKAQVY